MVQKASRHVRALRDLPDAQSHVRMGRQQLLTELEQFGTALVERESNVRFASLSDRGFVDGARRGSRRCSVGLVLPSRRLADFRPGNVLGRQSTLELEE